VASPAQAGKLNLDKGNENENSNRTQSRRLHPYRRLSASVISASANKLVRRFQQRNERMKTRTALKAGGYIRTGG